MDDVLRVEFDSTLDEFVDAHLRLAYRTKAFRRSRNSSCWVVGIAIALLVVLLARRSAGNFAPPTALVAIALAAAFGMFGEFLFGLYYDGYVRRHARRMLKEMFRGAERMRCEMELRREGLWSKSSDTVINFSWQRLRDIVDAEHGIELWFDPGLAIIRSRAFDTPERRHELLQRVRELAPAANAKTQSP